MANKKKKKNKEDDIFNYILLSSIFSTLLVTLSFYKINILRLDIVFFPIIIYLTNYNFKKCGFKTTFNSLLISISMIVMYLFLLYNLENRLINILEVFKYSLIYFISIFINLLINKNKKNTSKFTTSITYILPTIIYIFLRLILG